ncbi:MAG: MetQ/NlpA family ABC transporter substrate-binding protein [Eggerthellaceae bacterium]|nr:MetQ/NlpA family ABC transporter substrate-binding protein [Eggerthellaceae bacterium]
MKAIKKNRKLAAIAIAALGIVLAFGLAACGGSSSSSSGSASASAASDDKVIKVAASPTPHAVILNEAVAPQVEKAGYKLEVVEFTDYVLPNTATEDGEVDANYFQHIPYLDKFNEENGTHLVNVAAVHIEPMSVYAGKTASFDELADGATVAVPNDTTNEARALALLQKAGLIELNDPNDLAATPKDIKSNPKNLQFKEVEAATVPTILPDVDIAVINTNYAIGANLSKDLILITESAESPYVNVLVVKEGNENSEKTKVLIDAISSQEVKDYIAANFEDCVAV